jgi:hypothetical protein
MMERVRWEQKALDELTELWLQSDANLRELITQATNQIDKQLLRDPLVTSEPDTEGRRILYFPPLGVTFRLEDDGQTVSVLAAWLFLLHNGQE